MAKIAKLFGALLVVLGIAFFVMTGSAHKTALIPTWFGLAMFVCGVLATTEDAKKRMLWMHIAVTIGLLGFLFPGIRAGLAMQHASATGVALSEVAATAAHEELAMAAICLLFTVLCVRSFINARRQRLV
ncbi:MAG: hypothetical protein PW735_11905 [Acidobacteriaceae bacterium]|nr:hypothetical protein [Acidobacteriaceae bacterium]